VKHLKAGGFRPPMPPFGRLKPSLEIKIVFDKVVQASCLQEIHKQDAYATKKLESY